MIRFVLHRLLLSIPMLLGITLLTFILMRLSPGNFLDTLRLDPQISQETIEHYQKLYQLDQPVFAQYLHWIKNVCRLEFGYSYHFNVPVAHIIGGRLFNTFILALCAFLVTWLIAIPLGIWAAVHRGRLSDHLIQIFSYISLSIPVYFLAMILLFWASQSGVLPLGGMRSPNFEHMVWWEQWIDIARHLVIPVASLSIVSIGYLQKIMRGNMLEVLGQQYILTARAKGLSETRVIYIHALRNAINPLITLLGYEFSALLSGAALTEIICSWPGLGSLMLTAVRSKDIYLVMASMLMGSVMFLVGNLLADIALAKADPRITYDERT